MYCPFVPKHRPAARYPQASAVFKEAVAQKPDVRFLIRSQTRVVKRYPEGDW